jgi:hypothetical protein
MNSLFLKPGRAFDANLARLICSTKFYAFFWTLFFLAIFPVISANAVELRGKLYIIGPSDELRPVKNTTIRIQETDDADVTTDFGGFRLFLPDIFKAGEVVSLKVMNS